MRRVSGHSPTVRYAAAYGWAAYAGVIALAVFAVAAGVETFLNAIFHPQARPEVNEARVTTPIARTSSALRSVTVERTRTERSGSESAEPRSTGPESAGRLILTQDTWSEMLRDPSYWASRRMGGSGKWQGSGSVWSPFGDFSIFGPPPRRMDDLYGQTYRTVCVRLCDGAFFPLSYSTTREHFAEDAAKCEQSCGSASRMFVYRNPGGEPEDMEDLEGRPYKKLPTAFLYKTQYVEQCKCKPHPWEETSLDRHKMYALEAARAKGSKVVEAPLKELRAKVRQAELDVRAEKTRLAQEKGETQQRAAREARATKSTARILAPGRSPAGYERSAGLPPPPNSEPTARYQPTPPTSAGGAVSQSKRGRQTTAGSQTKTVRIPPPASWKELRIGR